MDDNNGRDSMLDMFIFEENQLIDQLEEIMLDTEKSGGLTSENINEIFRIMHTIKGSSAMMMYNNISKLAHSVEDLFFYIRENKPENLNISEICDLVLMVSDFIKQEVTKINDGKDPDGDESAMEKKIKDYLVYVTQENGGSAENKAQPKTVQKTPDKQPREADKSASDSIGKQAGKTVNGQKYIAKVYFEDGGQMENLRAYTIVHNLVELSQEIYTYPEDIINASSEFILVNGFLLFLTTDKDEKQIRSVLEEALFIKSYELTPVQSYDEDLKKYHIQTPVEVSENASDIDEQPKETQAKPNPGNASDKQSGDTKKEEKKTTTPNQAMKEMSSKGTKLSMISVNVNKLDMLLNLVGEIVISESMVTKNPDLKDLQLDNFNKAARQLRKLTDELQDIVMSIRMIQIAGTFQKMQRIVRDMSRKLNKDVEFVTVGEDTEVDKNIIDHLSDPLMHLIRNSMDHGVEPEEERVAKGKPPKARITLKAQNTGGDVMISVSDDGRGLNKEKILEKAKENGILTKPEKELTEQEIFNLILLPGFSTKDQVTEFSGRGVGMDVVKQNIEEVGGRVSIKSIEGEGTTTTIVIPLTLAIADAMELSVGQNVYTLPTVSIKESFRPKDNEIIYDNMGNEMIMIRGNVYPIIRLHKLFKIETAITKLSEGILIMVEGENKAACIFADKLLGEQQVVVKPLPRYLVKYKVNDSGIEGCTILGDGSISLILNAKGLINRII